MKDLIRLAAQKKDLGFFSLDPDSLEINWEKETAERLGKDAESVKSILVARLRSGLREYIIEGRHEDLRCIVPLKGGAKELFLVPSPEDPDGAIKGFFADYSLQGSLEQAKKYFLSNISNKLRSLLNSVIIAADVVATARPEAAMGPEEILSMIAEDAREVNLLLNRLGEIVSYTPPDEERSPEKIDTMALLAAIHANLHYLAEDASIALVLALPEYIPPVRGHYINYLLSFFLAVKYALSKTDPLGEIIITARDEKGKWLVEMCFGAGEIPADLAVTPEKHGLVPTRINSWGEAFELQLIDSLLGLGGGEAAILTGGNGFGLLRLSLGQP